MKIALFIASFLVLADYPSRQTLDYPAPNTVPVSGYMLKYKGFRCLKNKARNAGLEVKMYFLCIPEQMRPKEIATLTFDSLSLYENVKKETVQNGPVLSLFDGADTMGITLLCNIIEGQSNRNNTMNHLNEVLKEFKMTYHSENQPPTSNLNTSVDTAGAKTVPLNNGSDSKPQKWYQKVTTFVSLNPMDIAARIFQSKEKQIGKKYLYLSANDLKCYLHTPTNKAFDMDYHFSMILQKDKSAYEVYFEIVPK
jgi:hypothetical protein